MANDPWAEQQARYGALNLGGLDKNTTTSAPPKNSKKGSKNQNFLSSLISELGGAGGAAGGAALGATIGSAVPILGTAVGGLIGAGIGGFAGGTGGRLVENKVRDGEYRPGDALEEGAISGILGAGPGQLAKVARGGASALAGGGTKTLESALLDASGDPLKTSFSGKLVSKGNQLLANNYGTITRPVAKATGGAKTVGQIADFGITKPQDAERISNAITGSTGILNKRVLAATSGAGEVPIGNIQNNLVNHMTEVGLVGKDAKSVQSIVDAQLGRLGGGATAAPNQVLDVMKSLEKRAANLQGKGENYRLSTPERVDQADVLLKVRDELQDGLYEVAGANKNLKSVLTPDLRNELIALHPKNGKWQNYVDNTVMKASTVGDLRHAQAPFVNIGKIINEGEINSMTAGGRLGNGLAGNGGSLTGMAAQLGASVAKGPANRFAGSALRAAGGATIGGPVTNPGVKGIIGRVGLGGLGEAAGATYGSVRAGVPAFAAGARNAEGGSDGSSQSLEDTLMTSQDPTGANNLSAMQGDQQQQSASPYSQESLMADIKRDPKNSEKYIQHYQDLDKIFNPTQGKAEAPYGKPTASQYSQGVAGVQSIQALEKLLGSNPDVVGKNASPGQDLPLGVGSRVSGALGTGQYRAISNSILNSIARINTGANMPADEKQFYEQTYLPQPGDNQNTQKQKIANLYGFFSPIVNYQGSSSPTLEDALMSQGGY